MTIQEKVAEKIVSCGAVVFETVSDKLAQIEIDRRIDLITKSLSKQEVLVKEFKKNHKSDIPETYDSLGNIVGNAQFSKSRLDLITKDKEKLSNLIKITELCLEKNLQEDYNKLQESLNKLNNVGGSKPENSGENKSEA